MSMRIRILVTGGTFDKEYDELTGRLFFKETKVGDVLERGVRPFEQPHVRRHLLPRGAK